MIRSFIAIGMVVVIDVLVLSRHQNHHRMYQHQRLNWVRGIGSMLFQGAIVACILRNDISGVLGPWPASRGSSKQVVVEDVADNSILCTAEKVPVADCTGSVQHKSN